MSALLLACLQKTTLDQSSHVKHEIIILDSPRHSATDELFPFQEEKTNQKVNSVLGHQSAIRIEKKKKRQNKKFLWENEKVK